MRRTHLLAGIVLAAAVLMLTACTGNDDSSDTGANGPGATPMPSIMAPTPPALEELDMGRWGQQIFPKKEGAAQSFSQLSAAQPQVQLTLASDRKRESFTIACVSKEVGALDLSLVVDGGSPTTAAVQCEQTLTDKPKTATVEYDGGANAVLTVSGVNPAVFVVQSAPVS